MLTGARTARVLVMAVVGFASSATAQNELLSALQRIDRDRLCVTNGMVSTSADGQLAVETPSSRATVQSATENAADQIAEIHFRFLGPSQDSRPLASGELRRQIGLTLQTQDSCNLIYVMWRIEPDARVAVSIKRNADQHTHQQCGARGYINFTPQDRDSLPPIRAGDAHTLRAELHGEDLTVTADDKVAWQGSVGSEIALPIGPPGVRTDNARLTFQYFAAVSARSRPASRQMPPSHGRCVPSKGD